jgi:SNF2 family DNA or RNA helicase
LPQKLEIKCVETVLGKSISFDFSGRENSSVKIPTEFSLWAISVPEGKWALPTEFVIPELSFEHNFQRLIYVLSQIEKIEFEIDHEAEQIVEKLSDRLKELDHIRLGHVSPMDYESLKEKLKSAEFLRWNTQSQEDLRNISHLYAMSNGANFSVPGAGKTNSLLALFSMLRREISNLKLLVVLPKNAIISWDDEIAECLGENYEALRLTGGIGEIARKLDTDPFISVISYQQLRTATPAIKKFMAKHPTHLVLDESHRIKGGYTSLQGHAAIEISPLAVRRDIMSGTPMPQGLSDLVSQFHFLWPGSELASEIASHIDPEQQLLAARNYLRNFYVRTTKPELKLKDAILYYVDVDMDAGQEEIHTLLKSESARFLLGLSKTERAQLHYIAKQIMRLMQFASDPELIVNSGALNQVLLQKFRESITEPTAKMRRLDSLVDSILSKPGEKVVIWSSFVGTVEKLKARYSQFGATSIHGGVDTGEDSDPETREGRIRRFNLDLECRVMVANPAACGEGISLHKAAHNAIYFDRSFNAAHFLQSVDRIHRRGLPDHINTNIYILTLRNSIEEIIRTRLSEKVEALKQVLSDASLSSMIYDPEDVQDFGPEVAFMDESDLTSIEKFILQ